MGGGACAPFSLLVFKIILSNLPEKWMPKAGKSDAVWHPIHSSHRYTDLNVAGRAYSALSWTENSMI